MVRPRTRLAARPLALAGAFTLTAALAGCSAGVAAPAAEVADAAGSTSASAPADSALDAFVDAERASIPEILEGTPGTYAEVIVEARAPGSVDYTYVYAEAQDPELSQDYFDALVPTLQYLCDTHVFPRMADMGVQGVPEARYTYLNADGTELWSHSFSGS
ncbi:hypothetical protein [Demequina pelophila]|uniref:hypothetical protein n=1 Tax=Demequina pelophila TaxID=1638984 RepID=UPI0007801DDF|nr:hypothetical protein [Demequina pelophila]